MSKVPGARSDQATGRDHEHVDKISTTTTLFVLIAIALLLYEIRLILLPFVLSGLLAYICTPLIEWLRERSKLPRALLATGVFLILVLIGGGIVYAGAPPLILELKRFLTDLDPMISGMARGAIGSDSVKLFGQQMNAAQIAETMSAGFRNWIENVNVLAFIGASTIGTAFGSFLTLILLFYFLVSGPRIAEGLFWLTAQTTAADSWGYLAATRSRPETLFCRGHRGCDVCGGGILYRPRDIPETPPRSLPRPANGSAGSDPGGWSGRRRRDRRS